MRQIKWKFSNIEVNFVNREEKMPTEISKQAFRLDISPLTKIEIINDNFTIDDNTDCRTCNGDPTLVALKPISMGLKGAKIK